MKILDGYRNILDKLNGFTKKYYLKMLVKGVLLFLVFGLLFFFVIMGVEYFLWLNSTGRLFLLLAFVGVELYLLLRYILMPLFYLFKLRRGISNKQASLIIGRHFPQVGDKLYNLLDLEEDRNRSELLLASIEQRSEALHPIPFTRAVDFRESLGYAKYLVAPALLFGLVWLSGNLSSFFGSADRVVNYDVAYEPPAPFTFELLSPELDVLDTEPFTVLVATVGDVRPESVSIGIEGKEVLLRKQNGIFQYTFVPPLRKTKFYFSANGIRSREFTLNALKTPSIRDFKIRLDYPGHTEKAPEVLKSTGNAIFPEGTKVSWEILGANTENINLIAKDTTLAFEKNDTVFGLSKRIYKDFPYELTTSNGNVRDQSECFLFCRRGFR